MQRLRLAAVSLLLVVTAFHQSPGRIGNDTKLDLTADPGRFLRRSLDLWDPSAAFGRLQNQAYGYLFPMGPFHALGKAIGMPAWVVQRSWMALLLVVAFLGVVRLATSLGLGSPTTRILGGLAYALSPRVLTLLGGNSAELWPMAVLPWVLVPLVGPDAERRPRGAAMRSGVAVLCMGAANATTVLALLPLPALFLLPGLRRSAGRHLAAWWAVAVSLACAWWFVPLVLQARYSTDFLNYIETASTTTRFTSPAEVLRGTSHWLGYLSQFGLPWWRAGWLLVTNSAVILDTGVLAALGVVGLLHRRMPRQGLLVLSAAAGLTVMAAVHAGPLDGPLAGSLQDLLDGSLAAFRNIHKFDGLVRLPLALGLIHLVAQVSEDRARRIISGAVAIALVGAASPALAGQLVPAGSYGSIPSWWVQAGDWLDDHNATGHALVLPASGFAEYYWGRPLDQPLQALTSTSWAVRDAVPLGSPGNTRLLDAIEQRIDSGAGSVGLGAVLARMGVTYVVVSADLTSAGRPRPALIQQALADTPGLSLAARFGPPTGGDAFRQFVGDSGLGVQLPTLQVYAVDGGAGPVASLPTAGTWRVSGGPESLFQLADRGLLAQRATVLAGDGAAGPTPQSVLTDSLRRREINFGSVRDNFSQTLTPDAQPTLDRPALDVLPVLGDEHLATARVIGAEEVTASSSAADVDTLLHTGPTDQPLSAFDGDPATGWVSGATAGAKGEWVELTLDHPIDPTGATIRLGAGSSRVLALDVRTDVGTATMPIREDMGTQPLTTPSGLTRHLRVTASEVRDDAFGTHLSIQDITIPGVTVQSTVVLPDDQQQTGQPVVLLDRTLGARPSCVTSSGRSVCSPSLARTGEDDAWLDRTFSLHRGGVLPVYATALPVGGAILDRWLDRGAKVRVTASSRLVADPAVRPSLVFDDDSRTGWIAGENDPNPTLTLSWTGSRRVDQLEISSDDALVAARPTRVMVTVAGRSTELAVPADGVLRFPPQLTDRIEVRFVAAELRTSVDADGGRRLLPVGVSELSVPALDELRPPEHSPESEITLPCGSGPPLVVDGVLHQTAALGTRGALEHLRPVILAVCDGPTLAFTPGSHRLVGGTQGALRLESVELGQAMVATVETTRAVEVRTWNREHRIVSVGSGDESYLVVHENLNRGWHAELEGHELQPVRIDGWQQAWVVPAGSGGQVTLMFRPGRTFDSALVVGGLLALLLVALALLPSRAHEVHATEHVSMRSWRLRAPIGLAVLVVIGGAAGAAAYVALLAVVLLARQARDVLVATSGLALVIAAAITAAWPWNGPHTPALVGWPVQLCALIAVAAAAAVLSVPQSPTDASGPAPAAPRTEG